MDDTHVDSAARQADADPSAPLVSTHTHTNLSLCASPEMSFAAVVQTAAEMGYRLLVLCDHIHVPSVTNYPRHLARLRRYRKERDQLDTPVRVVVGGEFEVAAPGRVIAPQEMVAACEAVIAAPNHYHLDWIVSPRGGPAVAASHELDALQTILDWPPAQVVAHPFAGSGLEHTPDALFEACDRRRLSELLARAREQGVALEIQPKYWLDQSRASRLSELFEEWLSVGGKVALGSDAHSLQQLCGWPYLHVQIVARFGLTSAQLWWPEGAPNG